MKLVVTSGQYQSVPLLDRFPLRVTVTVTNNDDTPYTGGGNVEWKTKNNGDGTWNVSATGPSTVVQALPPDGISVSPELFAGNQVKSWLGEFTRLANQSQILNFYETNLAAGAGIPYAVQITQGNGQQALANGNFAVPIQIRLVDNGGVGIKNSGIQFDLPGNPGGKFPGNAPSYQTQTDTNGYATALVITADGTIGSWLGLASSLVNVSINSGFTAENAASVVPVPTTLVILDTGETIVVPGSAFGPVRIYLKDQFDTALPGATVTFTVPSGGHATFAGAQLSSTAVTAADGTATMPTLTAGATYGQFNLTITAGAATKTLALTTYDINAVSAVSVISGSNQQTDPSTQFAAPLVVIVRNSVGEAITGITLGRTVPATGASCVLSANAPTDANGQVNCTATANATTGTYQVEFSYPSATPALFTLQNAASANVTTPDTRPTTGFAGSGQNQWQNPAYITGNSSNANLQLSTTNTLGQLYGRAFGFTIPPGATILGLTFKFRASATNSIGSWKSNMHLSEGTVLSPGSFTISSTLSLAQHTLGGPAVLWGIPDLTAERINAATFGVCANTVQGTPTNSSTQNTRDWFLSVTYSTGGGAVTTQTSSPLFYCEA